MAIGVTGILGTTVVLHVMGAVSLEAGVVIILHLLELVVYAQALLLRTNLVALTPVQVKCIQFIPIKNILLANK